MFAICQQATRIVGFAIVCSAALGPTRTAQAQGDVVMGFDALMVMNSSEAGTVMGQPGWGGYGRFSYGGIIINQHTPLGKYGAFELRENGAGGSGVGFNFTQAQADNPVNAGVVIDPVQANMFPLLDRAGFGVNFDPSQYVAELVFKPLAGNTGDQLNMTLDTFDGFDASGKRRAEQWQWNFFGLANPDPSSNPLVSGPDADGFYTVRNNGGSMSQANAGFNGPSFMFQILPLPPGQEGDGQADFHNFEAFDGTGILPVPNGARQIHLQTPYDNPTPVENFAIKALRIVKLNDDAQEVARLDARSGFSQRFGSPFRRDADDPPINIGGTNYIPSDFNTFANTDMVSRFDQNGFTNIVLKTDDDLEIGGLALFQPPTTQAFDGTNATVDVRAKLTVPQGSGQADRIVLVLKDRDGSDTGPGLGADEYQYELMLMLNQFNTSTMTTVSVPLGSFNTIQASEFTNAGDGSLANFNLYHLGVQTLVGIGVVNLEIESIRVMLPAPPGLTGDHNGDGKVDAADYVVWRKDPASFGGQQGYDDWRANFGAMSGSGAAASAGSVPEPTTWLLAAMVVSLIGLGRRR